MSKLGMPIRPMTCIATGIVIALAATPATLTARAEPIVIVESTHTLNFAEAACKSSSNTEVIALCNSVNHPSDLGRILENTIISKFAVTEQCKGVTVALSLDPKYDGDYYDRAAARDLMRQDYWSLLVNYTPVGTQYDWSLFPEPMVSAEGSQHGNVPAITSEQSKSGDRRALQGKGTPAQIVREICIAVTGQGATVR